MKCFWRLLHIWRKRRNTESHYRTPSSSSGVSVEVCSFERKAQTPMAGQEGLACIKPGFPFHLDENVWYITTSFYYFNLLDIQNNGLIIKEGTDMIVINMPKLSEAGFKAVKDLCEFENAEVKVLIASGDWHHGSIHLWQANFPEAKTYLVSGRNLKKNQNIRQENTVVLDEVNPSIPELEGTFDLLPILGCSAKPVFSCAKEPRNEVVLFHKASGTLYITDHCMPGTPPGLNFSYRPKEYYVSCNTGGFQISDKAAAKASAEKVLELQGVKRVIFSHKKPDNFGIYAGDDILQGIRAGYDKYFTSS